MGVKIIRGDSLDGCPDSSRIKERLELIKNKDVSMLDKRKAINYLIGVIKVSKLIPRRKPLAAHLENEIHRFRTQ